MAKHHLESWMNDLKMITYKPTTMPKTKSFLKSFEAAVGDPDKSVQANLEKEYKFPYRSGIGETIYAMVTACQASHRMLCNARNMAIVPLHRTTTR